MGHLIPSPLQSAETGTAPVTILDYGVGGMMYACAGLAENISIVG